MCWTPINLMLLTLYLQNSLVEYVILNQILTK